MKHSAFVFGLASLVTACAAQPRHPLCNGDGSPACGNIGQLGRGEATKLRAMHAVLGASAESAREVARPDPELSFVITRPSVRAKSRRTIAPVAKHPVSSPSVDSSPARPPDPTPPVAASSAVIDPTVPPRQHRLASPKPHQPLLAAFAMSELALQTARPRLAADDDVAVGNVMSKGGHKHRRLARPLLTAPEQPTLAVQRPRVTDDDDVAVGNVMDKKKQ